MSNRKSTFALLFGNRGFFPAFLMKEAREELPRVIKEWGHEVLMMPEDATPHGAVETTQEGKLYADWLRRNHGKYDGVILSLPNFGDETGAVAALKDAGVPILIQAYPDDLDKMQTKNRRDSFCGKVSVMNVFYQYGVTYTALKPHTVKPSSERFHGNVDYFDRLCRVVNGVKEMTVGALGARTTPFKTVRIDETTLQRHGITVETMDLSEVFARVKSMSTNDDAYKERARALSDVSSWEGVPEIKLENLTKLSLVLDDIADEFGMDALSLRCWTEMQTELGISPCLVLGMLNEVGRSAACEVDVGNAVMMYALQLASAEGCSGLLDWNNNYGDDDDKCILFHCGPMPMSMMTGKGRISDHAIISESATGSGSGFGCNTGRIVPTDMTLGSLSTGDGKIRCFLGEGRFTDDPIPEEFFGCAGVAHIPRLQDVMQYVGMQGFRHHVSVAPGHIMEPLREALGHYLGFEVTVPQDE